MFGTVRPFIGCLRLRRHVPEQRETARTGGRRPGAQAEAGKTVKVHYTGRLLDGTKFDSSLDRNDPIEFVLGKGMVIPGWDEGIALLKVGGKALLVIPSNLAYGSRGAGGVIPPFAPLTFEVELVSVQ